MRRHDQKDGIFQKKSLSQIFLKVEWPVERMVSLLSERGIKRVIEIGPGAGILTRALLGAGIAVIAVEKDPRFAQQLLGRKELWESLNPGKLEVLNEDILKCNLGALIDASPSPTALIGNIPYHISSPIIQLGIEHLSRLAVVLVMTQLEFARRVAAAPGTKDYGSLSVFAQLRSMVTLEYTVDRTCFEPIPKVDSAVMMLCRRSSELDDDILAQCEILTRTAFSQRRKKLSNSLARIFEGVELADCPVDLSRRADALSPEEYFSLADWLTRN